MNSVFTPEELNKLKEQLLSELELTFSKVSVNLWFSDIEFISYDGEKMLACQKSVYKRNVVKTKYLDVLESELSKLLSSNVKLEFTDCSEKEKQEKKETDFQKKPSSSTSVYTFKNFIQGSSNKLAYAACFAVASIAGEKDYNHVNDTYNPLFIYGQSGLGKTHLMYSIKNYVEEKYPDVTLIYIKGEDFMNEMIDAISSRKTPEFRDKFRKADILIIDDIQFIANKPGVQEEIFHTFNNLYESNKQIVFTSDKPPKDINPLEERLRTRFEASMIADIQPPDIELRMAIIKAKANAMNITIPNEVVTFFADRLKENVRQIEGAIRKTAAISFLTGSPVSVDIARQAISDLVVKTDPVNMMQDKIISIVCKKYNVSKDDIRGETRNATVVNARNISIYLMNSLTDMNQNTIASYYGKTHSTINHSLSKIENMISKDKLFEEEINELIADITA